MISIICDRCGRKIGGTTYYTISIWAYDINPQHDRSVTCSTALQNSKENLNIVFNGKKQFCERCKDEIEMCINKSMSEFLGQ